jgi:hypothetical protein
VKKKPTAPKRGTKAIINGAAASPPSSSSSVGREGKGEAGQVQGWTCLQCTVFNDEAKGAGSAS